MVSLLQNVSILLKLKVLICVRIKQRIHGDTFWKKTWTCCVFHLPRQTFKSKRDKDDLCLLLLASWKDTALMEKKRTTGVIDGCRGFNVDCCKELQLSCDALGPTKCMDLLWTGDNQIAMTFAPVPTWNFKGMDCCIAWWISMLPLSKHTSLQFSKWLCACWGAEMMKAASWTGSVMQLANRRFPLSGLWMQDFPESHFLRETWLHVSWNSRDQICCKKSTNANAWKSTAHAWLSRPLTRNHFGNWTWLKHAHISRCVQNYNIQVKTSAPLLAEEHNRKFILHQHHPNKSSLVPFNRLCKHPEVS